MPSVFIASIEVRLSLVVSIYIPTVALEIRYHLCGQMVAVHDRPEHRVPTSSLDASLQRLYLCIEIWFKEERHACTVVGSSMDDPVICGFPFAICPSFNHVTNIHDKGVRYRVGVDPGTIFELNLKGAFRGIGEEEGDTAVI